MPKVSIIVAIYNIEPYINRCVKSLLQQVLTDIEIILVNDCSTDNTKKICDELAKSDKRIKLINKTVNEGLSEARNTGIKEATGEYIAFVDGDDYVENDTYYEAYNYAINNKLDEVVFESYYDKQNKAPILMPVISNQLLYHGKEEINKYFAEGLGSDAKNLTDYAIGFAPWNRIFRNQLFSKYHIKFISERRYIYEDLVFFLNSTPYINSVGILNKPFYHYCQNKNSLTQKVDPYRFFKIKKMCTYILSDSIFSEMIQQANGMNRFKRTIQGYIRLCIMQLSSKGKYYSVIKEICNDKFTMMIFDNYPIYQLPRKQKIIARLIICKNCFLLYIICNIYGKVNQ